LFPSFLFTALSSRSHGGGGDDDDDDDDVKNQQSSCQEPTELKLGQV
jgi:hypothetical protein